MEKKVAIWLDDVRPVNSIFAQLAEKAGCKLLVATNARKFKILVQDCIIEKKQILYISFDHDLGKGATGYDVAKWLCELILDGYISELPKYFVHSANPVGKANILGYFKNFEDFIQNKKGGSK